MGWSTCLSRGVQTLQRGRTGHSVHPCIALGQARFAHLSLASHRHPPRTTLLLADGVQLISKHAAPHRVQAVKPYTCRTYTTARAAASQGSPAPTERSGQQHTGRRWQSAQIALAGLIIGTLLYNTYDPFRHSLLATVRCSRLMKAVLLDVIDYKRTFAKETRMGDDNSQLSPEERRIKRRERSACHRRSAERIMVALRRNGGVFVKMGQHVAAVAVLPPEWTETLAPLQDQCSPTPISDIDEMLKADMGLGIDDLFVDFEEQPIGVASLAQVHRAIDRRSGRPVAVKVQHADLQEFAAVDMATVNFATVLVKHIFPEFEFDWLAEEMDESLPKEMNFRHEAANAKRCRQDFQPLEGKTSLHIPEVLWAERRCMAMEYIEGARIDDLAYLKAHKIDRNQVSQELSRIFSQMVYLNGFFHSDPHHGNLLIRPKAAGSKSPFNFDICLLDHGQYFEVPAQLRVDCARFWLSLMTPSSPQTLADRKKYAKLLANIDGDMYPYLESAITGRVSMDQVDSNASIDRPLSLLDGGDTARDDTKRLQSAIADREGVIASVFELLRTIPRRLLMIVKLCDLQRSLDSSLATTHGQNRVYLILGRYCAEAIWRSDVDEIRDEYARNGLSLRLCKVFISDWLSYTYCSAVFSVLALGMDVRARLRKVDLFISGLLKGGWPAASQQMAGLSLQ